jgi:hypothetical protein
MNLARLQSADTCQVSKTARSATLAVIALGFAAACTSSTTGGSEGANASPSTSSSASTSPSPATVVTPATPKPGPAPLGWPRPGWTAQTLGFSGISVSIPDTWHFDNNEVGLWTDGTTVEPRAFIVKGDVWIECGAITRGTTSTAPELHDIIDSIQIVDPGAMRAKSYMENP